MTILINDDPENSIKTPAGSTLLNTLAANGIFIPSACGGKGTCGVCKVDVHSGGGSMLPTEESHTKSEMGIRNIRYFKFHTRHGIQDLSCVITDPPESQQCTL